MEDQRVAKRELAAKTKEKGLQEVVSLYKKEGEGALKTQHSKLNYVCLT